MVTACWNTIRPPTGIIIIPTNLTSLSREAIISESSLCRSLVASLVRREMYESAPTAVSTAAASPDTTKLPDSSLSPGAFAISSASPVSSASFTCTLPSSTRASAGIWLPALRIITSSRTSFSTGTSVSRPSRIAWALGILSSFSLSRVRLERISWKMPIPVFASTISMKVSSLNDPTMIKSTASTVNIRLK